MSAIIIKNGHVFDYLNKINGDVMDIFIENGKIVEKISDESKAKVIDAKNKTVMPGGVDSHSHIAGPKVNTGRLMRPEDSRRFEVKKTKITQSGTGETVPTCALTGYLYSIMGYTTVMEAAMPPLEALHTHEELKHTPMIDKGAYTIFGNNWFVMRYLKEKQIEKCAAYVAWMLRRVKGYGIKIVNPAGVTEWGWGRNVEDLDQKIPNFDITSREIIDGLAKVNEILNLPMSIHLHANNLGKPGNAEITEKSLRITENLKINAPNSKFKRRQNIYLTHAQFNSFAGNGWSDFASGSKLIVDYVNSHDNVVIDLGAIPFGNATVMTGDGPAVYYLHKLTGGKWSNKDIEVEGGAGILPFEYKMDNPIHSIQWAIGLELAIYVNDLSKVILTTDHPNGGPFTKYPKIIAWLMSSKYRKDTINSIHKLAIERSRIIETEREFSLYDIETITRATPAMSIGLAEKKGHLGIGADADIAIYDIDPKNFDSSDYNQIIEKFSRALYTIKGGEILVENGEIKKVNFGKTFYTSRKIDDEIENEILKDVKSEFRYYTTNFENYGVDEKYLDKVEVM